MSNEFNTVSRAGRKPTFLVNLVNFTNEFEGVN